MKSGAAFVWVFLLILVSASVGWYMAAGNGFLGVALGLFLAVCVQQLGLVLHAADQVGEPG